MSFVLHHLDQCLPSELQTTFPMWRVYPSPYFCPLNKLTSWYSSTTCMDSVAVVECLCYIISSCCCGSGKQVSAEKDLGIYTDVISWQSLHHLVLGPGETSPSAYRHAYTSIFLLDEVLPIRCVWLQFKVLFISYI